MTEIHERVLITSLHIGVWSGRKHDKRVTDEAISNNKAESGAGRFSKQLVSNADLKGISQAHSLARQRHYTLTLPWDDDGKRIVASKAYNDYAKEMQICKQKFYTSVQEFVDDYNNVVNRSEQRLGMMFDSDEFPSVKEVERKFSFDVEVLPLPRGDDIRVDIHKKEIETISKDIERRTNDRVNAAVRSVYERAFDVLTKMIEGLEAYKPKGKDQPARRFRDSLIFNVEDVANLLPSLNITGDPKIEEIHKQMLKDLCEYAPEQIRAHDDKRIETTKKAKDVLKKVEQYMA